MHVVLRRETQGLVCEEAAAAAAGLMSMVVIRSDIHVISVLFIMPFYYFTKDSDQGDGASDSAAGKTSYAAIFWSY